MSSALGLGTSVLWYLAEIKSGALFCERVCQYEEVLERKTPRALARDETIERIKSLALSQLASGSASELSLRAIARELNLVSSAIYRYFPSKDELLTALIADAYSDLASVLVEVTSSRRQPRGRWIDACAAVRSWAVAEPHRFALIYGSAIPGYRAPETTIGPAAAVVAAFAQPVVASFRATGGPHVSRPLPRALRGQLSEVDKALELGLPESLALDLVAGFTRLIGVLTLELNGHFVGTFEPADAFFDTLMAEEADKLGL